MTRAISVGDMLYDEIGDRYNSTRQTEPRIAERIWEALGNAQSVLNVGAGTGSYEPSDRAVTAVEPSAVMRAQRPPGAAPCVDARADALPFADRSFDAAMAILSDHHWPDPIAGLREMGPPDLESGAWRERNRLLLELDQADVGARLLIAG